MTHSVIARRTIGGASFEIDTAKDRLDIGLIHHFLSSSSHWSRDIPRVVVERSITNSVCFGLYRDGVQIGFARVVTDETTFAYLADVFVVDEHRNAGLGQFLVMVILDHAPLQGLRRWLLVTRDAASLYRRCGFSDTVQDCTYLERLDPDIYRPATPERAAAN
jgi:GNAT superfamily N-acetyltransferase